YHAVPPRLRCEDRRTRADLSANRTRQCVTREADRDGGQMAEVGKRVGERRSGDQAADQECEIDEPQSRADEISGKSGDGEEAVADPDVASQDDGRVGNAGTEGDPQAGRDEQAGADVPGREDERQPPPTEPPLD